METLNFDLFQKWLAIADEKDIYSIFSAWRDYSLESAAQEGMALDDNEIEMLLREKLGEPQ